MRTVMLLSAAFFLSLSGPVFGQDWVEYVNREDGFRVDFPGQPKVQDGTWTSEYGYTLPTRIYSANRGQERYSITVVDYRGVEALGVARANGCPAGAEPCRGGQAGSVIGPGYWKQDVRGAVMYATFKLLQRDAKLTHLMWNWTDLVDGNLVQLTNADRSRTFAAVHMHDNRLYILEGTVPEGYPEPGLFQQSMGFVDREGNGIRYQALYTAYTGLGESPMPNRAGGGRGAGAGPAGAAGPPAAAAPAAAPTPAPAGPRLVVSYVEVAPASAKAAAGLMTAYRDATRNAPGNSRMDIFQHDGRPGQFMVVEEWRDEGTWKSHRTAAHVTQFHNQLTPLRVGPYDERLHTGLAIAPAGVVPASAVLVVTHIDVTGAGAAKVREMLRVLAETARKETGNLRFDALQGVRQNHFTVVELWSDERAREAHLTGPPTRSFRDGLYQFAVDGAPYDERLYRLLTP